MMRSLVMAAVLSGCGGISLPDVAVDVDVGAQPEPAIVAEADAGTQQIAPVTEIACASLGTRAFTQGELLPTTNATDFAILGAGYFVLERDGSTTYSRFGRFNVSDDGRLITTGGRVLQGLKDRTLAPLNIGSVIMAPTETSVVTLSANLDASSPMNTFDPQDIPATTALTMYVTIYDQLGVAHSIDVFWVHVGEGEWQFHAMTDGSGIDGGNAGLPTEIATGTAVFDARGVLVGSTGSSAFTARGATVPQALTFQFVNFTQFGSLGMGLFASQDGAPAGALNLLQVNPRGELIGTYSNGKSRVLGTVPLALFTAPQALLELPGHVLLATDGSGSARIDAPILLGRGEVYSSMIEKLTDAACTP